MDNILDYLPYFSNPENEFYENIYNPSQKPYKKYSKEVHKFCLTLYHENMIQTFPWKTYTKQAREYYNKPTLIAEADLPTIQKLFTIPLRAEKYCQGQLGNMIDNEIILKLLLRLKTLKNGIKDRFKGSLTGLAVGDALGVTLEFQVPGTFEPLTDIIGGGSFNLKPGEWTDDTSTALCLTDSLVEKEGFDPVDQIERYVKWYKEGYLSVNETCFDIGNTTREALNSYIQTGNPYSGPDYEHSAGNGSIMRLAPVPLYYYSNPQNAINKSADSSRTTHQHPLVIDACKYMAGIIIGALTGQTKDKLLSKRYSPIPGYWDENKLHKEVDKIACGSFKHKKPPEIKGSGYVIKSLEAALWAFHQSTDFEEGCLLAVNLGDDADTTGAVYGQIAGAYYGETGIPTKWIKKLAKYKLISDLTNKLMDASNRQSI